MDGGSDWRTAFKRFAAGAAGGGIDSLFTMPFDTMKTQMQLNREMGASVFRCGRQILVTDGIPGFYKGYVPFAIMAMGKASVRWGTFGVFCKAVDGLGFDRTKNKMFWTATCGTGAGVCEALCWTAPNERLKVLRQVSAGMGIRTVPYHEIFAKHGIGGLWVGATPTALRSASNAAIRFSIAGHVKGVFRWLSGTPEKDALPFYANFLAGGTGGAISVVMNNPVDVVKSKMQSGQTSGLVSTFRTIYAEQGLIGFGAGITARVPQIFLSQAIQFMVIEKLMAG